MTTICPHCGGILIPGQPLCTDCGKAVDVKPSGATAPPAAAPPAARAPAPGRRDKQRDFALVGKVIADKYKILEVLGQGGFGTVYLVEITAGMVGEKLALKLLPAELSQNHAIRDQFVNEIRVAMKMVDKYIVQIRDVGTTEDDLLYYTMDYVAGKTLAEVLRDEGALAVPRAILIIMKVLRALTTAHAGGIIHRDLKPANVMVQSQGGRETVRVLDFGIATAIRTSAPAKQKGFVGSPYYMPPEQFMGEKLGFYTDIYSVGVMLYECITGTKPYGGSTAQEVFQNLKRGRLLPPESLSQEVSAYPGLSGLILKALERNPERRFQTARDFFDVLNAVLLGTATEGLEGAPAGAASPDLGYAGGGARLEGPRGGGAALAAEPAAPPIPGPAARELAARVRRRRSAAAEARPKHAGAVALGAFLLGAVVLALIFHKEIRRALAPPEPQPTVAAGDAPAGAGKASEKKEAPRTPGAAAAPAPKPARNETPPPTPGAAIVDEKKAAEAKLARWLEDTIAEIEKAGRQGDWKEASTKAEAVLRQAPENARALRWLGAAALQEKDFERAEEMLARARAAAAARGEASDPELLLLLARARLGHPRPHLEEAEEAVKEALGPNAKNPEALLVYAEILEKAGRTADLASLRKATETGGVTSPALEEFWRRVYVEEPEKAREEANRLLEEARKAFAARNWKGAIDLGTSATEHADRVGLGALASEGEILAVESRIEMREIDSALKFLKIAQENVAQRRSGAATLPASGAAGADSGSVAVAIPEDIAARLEGRLNYLRGRAHLGDYEKAGVKEDLDEAMIGFDMALDRVKRLDKKSVEEFVWTVRMWRARIHAARGDIELLTEDLKPIRDRLEAPLIEHQVQTYLFAAAKADKKEAREQAYEAAMGRLMTLLRIQGLGPELEREAQYLLGTCYLNLGILKGRSTYYPQAMNCFLYAERAGLSTPQLYENWGQAYERKGQLARAAEKYGRVYDLVPTPANCLRAADYHLKASPRSSEGLDLLRAGLQRFPDDPGLKSRYLEATKPSKSG